MREDLDAFGFALRSGAIAESALDRLLAACTPTVDADQVRHPSGKTYGIRGLLWSSRALTSELDISGLSTLATAALSRPAFPIDAIFFDKTADANWTVPGHQDRLMPIETGSANAKIVRNGIAYTEPTPTVLSALVALRVHFDGGPSDGGELEVVPSSHRGGILSADAIRQVPVGAYRSCSAARGDVLLMRPLLLHRSRRRGGPGHRRVLHVVFATDQPPAGARWKRSA